MNKRFRKAIEKQGFPRTSKDRAKRDLGLEALEERHLLAANPQLVAILPNSGELLQQGRVLNTAPDELLIRFDENQSIDASSLDGIRLISSGGDQVFGNGNDTTITPGYIGIGEELNEVIIRFGEALSDDLYQIQIIGFGSDALRNTAGDPFDNDPNTEGLQDLEFNFRLDLGAKVTAVVPQPVSRADDGSLVQARNQIVVYFNDDDLNPALAQNPAFYQLIETNETATNQDDSIPITPVSVAYDEGEDKAILSFGRDLDQLSSGTDTFRLRIGNSEAIPAPPIRTEIGGDPGSSYDSAFSLGVLAGRGRVLASSIDPQLWRVTLPGSNEDPGSRFVPYRDEQHVQMSADGKNGTTTIAYNFRNELGADENGSPFFNFITEDQKQRAREAFELWSHYAGVEFIESETSGITIGFGDLRALTPEETGGRGDGTVFATFTDPTFETGMVILDIAEQWDDAFGDNSNPTELSWFRTAMAGIGHLIGLGNATDLPAPTILSNNSLDGTEVLFPGPYDITHAQFVHRPDSIDVDLYQFDITEPGVVTIETSAERLTNASLLDTTLQLFREDLDGTRELIGQNDDYFSNDSFIKLSLEPGKYYLGVSSTGNADYDPTYENSGSGGTTQGRYEVRIDFSPQVDNVLRDASGTAFDGDSDGNPNGVFNYWFRAAPEANTVFVDKSADVGGDGSRTAPFTLISQALESAREGDIVRIVGNGGTDGDLATVDDNLAYLVGFDLLGQPLPDGTTLSVPKGVTVMVEAGATFKMNQSTVQVGSTSPEVDRSKSAFQILGTPEQQVYFTSFNNESVGQDTNPQLATTPSPGDWGGIAFQNDVDQSAGRFDYESEGIFLNYIAFADMQYGGGMVVTDSIQQVVTPIDMTNARPTVVYTRITDSADAAMSANPDSFEETTFHAPSFQSVPFTSDYSRIGPNLNGNILIDNSTNGLFVQIQTPAGELQQKLTVSGRWDDTDITHIVAENLIIQGQPGGPIGTQISGNTNIPVDDRFFLTSRLDASLVIDPGIVVKVDGARIETGIGAQLIAEGSPNRNIIFTSIDDDRYGAGGTFDARSDGQSTTPNPGDWAGLYFGHVSSGSVDNVFLAYAGGITKIEGTFTGFNAIEVHQADVRITNSVFDDNAIGIGGQAPANRLGRGANAPGVVFVLGAEPIIVGNTFRDTQSGFGFGTSVAPAINIDANSLSHTLVNDWGRSIGPIHAIGDYQDNHGALIRDNEYINNATNGMVVRGGTLTTQSVWDDTDVVHVVLDEIIVPNVDSYGGLRLESSPTESLVVKFSGANAGFTATGQALDIVDRIGGSIQIIGQPSNPVILTSLRDDSASAGFVNDTDNNGQFSNPSPGDWRGITIDAFANDRNVAVYLERELPTAVSPGANDTPSTAELVGNLAPNEKSGDDNRRLGFEVHGFLNQSTDVDVYSFEASTGTQVWIDIDRTAAGLDTVVELVTAQGVVLASSDDSALETATALGPEEERLGALTGAGRPMDVTDTLPGDLYSSNQFDAGMRLALPGSVGSTGTYHVVVRSGDYVEGVGGNSSGAYELQVRLRETDEIPGNMVQFADISYAQNGISVLGQPGNSPLLGDFSETNAANDDLATAQDLGNLLVSNQGGLSVSGLLSSTNDVDWYQVEVQYESVTRLNPDEAVSVVFDIDYADGLGRPDTMLSVFSPNGALVATSNNAGVADDIPKPNAGSDTGDLSRGSVSFADPMLGPIQLIPGTYYVAVSGGTMPAAFDQFENGTASADNLARFEPLDSINRVGEDHADFLTVARTTTAENPQIPIVFGEEFAIVIPEGVDIREGETIAVESLAGQKVTFEFDSEGFFLIPPDPSELVEGETFSVRSIPFFGGASTLETFRLTRQGFSIDIKAPTRISDGDSFFIEGPTGFIGFEFDSNFLSSTGIAIPFIPGQTAEEIAATIADTINSTGVLTATAVEGVVQLGNASGVFSQPTDAYDVIEPGGSGDNLIFYNLGESQLEIATSIANAINATGVATATVTGLHSYRVQIQNAQDVILSQGGGMVANQPVRAGNFPIPYTTADDATTIGAAIESAIDSAMGGNGVTAFSTFTTGQGAEVTLTDSSATQTFFGSTTFSLLDPNPIVGLSPGSDMSLIRPGIVPYTLQDVTLFVVDAFGLTNNTNSHLATYDAYTGARETVIGPFGEVVGDVARRDEGRGQLYSITYTNNDRERNDETSGTTIRISPTNGATEQLGEDGIGTFVVGDDPMTAEKPNDGAGWGIDYQAMTFIAGNRFVAVGSRNDAFFADPTAEEYANNPFILQGNEYRTNLVYLFDENGGSRSNGDPRTGMNGPEYLGGGTDIVELGHIDTVNDVGNTTGTILIGVPATGTNFGGSFANISDGMTLEFQDGTSRINFEFESGPETRLTANPSFGETVRDGELFVVDGTRFTFDTGSVIVVESNGGGFSEGDSITIIDDNDVLQTFEFDSDGSIGGDRIAIPYTESSSQGQMISGVVNAINSANFRAQAISNGNRISLTNDSSVSSSSSGVRTVGSSGIAAGVALPVEEFYTNDQIAEVIVNAFKSISPITVSYSGDRLNFLGANAADFSGTSIAVGTGARNGLSDPNAEPIEFLVGDNANTISARIMNAVNQRSNSIATQLTNGTISIVTNGSAFTSTDSPITIGGAPTGGTITGVAYPPDLAGPTNQFRNVLYAVSDNGGLFEFDISSGTSKYVATASDLVGTQFTGLTFGPEEIEFGRYANTLFAIDALGSLHAFDTLGQSVPVFANGASSVPTGAFDPVGLAFGSLQENLWSTGADINRFLPGHGVEIPVTDSRLEEANGGNSSYHFGVPSDDPADRNFDFPGGSHGSMVSNTFSLKDYSAADQPMLYFNYWLANEGAVYNPNANPPQPMRDSMRVYIMDDREDGDRGEWYLLATNNEYRNNLEFDEFDDMDINDGIHIDVQELYDNTTEFRQARVSLEEFAGRENLRLRFEFSSAGGVSLGNDQIFSTGTIGGGNFLSNNPGFGGQEGTELYAVPADRIRDGHTFELGGYTTGFFGGGGANNFGASFEFDLGYTLVPPSGDRIPDGETFTLVGNSGASVTYEFDKDDSVAAGNVGIAVRDTMSAADVASSMEQALATSDLGQPTIGDGNFVGNLQFEGNDSIPLAIDTGLNPAATGVFLATGQIGDNQAVSSFDDVDFIKFDLDVGDSAQIRVPSSTTNVGLRLFDANGLELLSTTGGFFGGGTPALDFTASVAGSYFVGISSTLNTIYDPLTGVSPANSGANGGTIGDYQVQVTIGGSRLTTFLTDNRLNMRGLSNVLQGNDPLLFVDGSPGVQNPGATPVLINGGMSEVEVASAIENALSDAYSQGNDSWVIRREEMIKIGGRDVIDAGPLGKSDHLWGDFTSAFNWSWTSQSYPAGPFGGLDNTEDGAYIDDIIIGFAERGELVTNATPNTAFIPRTDISDRTIVTGPYQLEIRESVQYGTPDDENPNLDLLRGFDTNERLTDAVRLDVPDGSELSTGQTFTIGDGKGEVVFEYVDATITEGNDTIATAEPSNLPGGLRGTYVGLGQIGGNQAFDGDNSNSLIGTDVDFIELDLQENDLVVIDVDSYNPDDISIAPSNLDSALILFDERGNLIAISDDDLGPEDLNLRPAFLDPALTFVAPLTGKYYAAISQAQNVSYDPMVAGSGVQPFTLPTFREPWFRNNVTVIEEQPTILTGGTYQVNISLNGGAIPTDIVEIPFASFDSSNDIANRVASGINSDIAQSQISFTAAPVGPIVDLHGENIVVTAVVTSLVPESNDTLETATKTNAVVGRSSRFKATGLIGDNDNLDIAGLDIDLFEVDLEFGGLLTVDVDAFDVGTSLRAGIIIFDSDGNTLDVAATDPTAFTDPTTFLFWDPLTPLDRKFTQFDPTIEFRAPETGTYYVGIAATNRILANANTGVTQTFVDPLVEGSGRLVDPFYNTGSYTALIQVGDGSIGVEINDLYGDTNIRREQGALILDSNRITNSAGYGILVDAGARNNQDGPRPGTVRNLPDINVNGFVPGVVIRNNVVARSGTGGILFSGDPGGDQVGAVPFGRIVNNTIYGAEVADVLNPQRNTVGIEVTDNASPTLLNNIVSEVGTGIAVDASSSTTVVGGTLFYNNDVNSFGTLGDFPIQIGGFQQLFADPLRDNFYLVDGSPAIDSSIDSLADRVDLINIRDTLGIPVSPILAPDFDNAGQLRVDDPNVQTPVGQGENVFKDRGAIDRSDFTGPRALMVNPLDNDPTGRDTNRAVGTVIVPSAVLQNFVIDLIDNTGNGGVGVDDDSVTPSVISVQRDGELLIEGEDYRFEYSRTNNQIRLSPITGIWPPNSSFQIELDNNAIEDLAGNSLSPNELDGDTVFFVSTDLGRDFGDAPAPYPTSLEVGGARHQLIDDFYLGTGVTAETNVEGADDLDDGITFGSSFVGNLTSEISVLSSGSGFIDAWVDWNRDGDWDDLDEQILVKREVSTGSNTFVVKAPESIPLGETYARFRLSSLGDLSPVGLAADGEVEDYAVTVGINPWQNSDNNLDVNGLDGVTPIDALLVINELNDFVHGSNTTGRLPIPGKADDAPFFDVNGDGFVSPLDALLIINSLPSTANAVADTLIPAAAPLDKAFVGVELVATKSSFAVTPIIVGPNMSVEIRSTSVKDSIWATGENNNQREAIVDRRASRNQNRALSTATRQLVDKAEPHHQWTDLVDDIFDDEITRW